MLPGERSKLENIFLSWCRLITKKSSLFTKIKQIGITGIQMLWNTQNIMLRVAYKRFEA